MDSLRGDGASKLGKLARGLLQTVVGLRCPQCEEPVPADDLSLSRSLIMCRSCGAEIDVVSQFNPEGAPLPSPSGPVEMPKGIEIVEEDDAFALLGSTGGRLVIRRRWFTPTAFVYAGFALFGNGIAWLSAVEYPDEAWVLLVLVIAVLLNYVAAARFVNRSTITADREHLRVQNGPLPWWGRREIASSEILRVNCRQITIEDSSDDEDAFSAPRTLYWIDVVMKDGRGAVLLPPMNEAQQARFIQQRIERYLGLGG